MHQWIKGNAYTLIDTLSTNYITLNSAAASHFSDVKWALIGVDEEKDILAIKPITKQDIDLHLYPLENLHKVTNGTGYARISNRALMASLAQITKAPLSDNVKYKSVFDEKENMLIVDLNTKED